MKNLIYIVILLSTLINCKAQFNLVPNASFENYTSCPSTAGQLNFAAPWINPTTAGTPDYHNSCSAIVGVPYCGGGVCFQYAKTGNAYSGIWCYDKQWPNGREYVQAQLTSTLSNGKCYYIGFYVNSTNWAGMGCNKLGVYVSLNAVSLTGTVTLLNYTSQIKSFNNKIIIDTLGWNLIGGIFQSSGNEQYITVGNFNTDATTDTVTYNPSAVYPKGAYYFIDDVFVIPIDSIGGMPAFAGNNVTINSGDSTFIGQQISNLNCTWYNGTVQIASNISGIYVQPTVTTTYVVQQNLCGNITTDTVVVTVLPNVIEEFSWLNNIIISPNPSDGRITLTSEKYFSDLEIKISNVTGKLISIDDFKGIKKEMGLNLKDGIYFITIRNKETNQQINKKIIIQN